ncbi:TetR/AcrR family transcriptional regulator [Nocardia sp. NPDC003345]
MSSPLPPGRRRRSPATRAGRETLNAGSIAAAMLELAGRSGFASVTMQDLAAHLGVTVRAVYRHVRDRQDVVDRAVQLWLSGLPDPELDPGNWRASLREFCDLHREVGRRHPRALLVALDEQVGTAGIPARRLTAPEAFLRFLTAVGLDLREALLVHSDLMLRLYGFALFVDFRADAGAPIAEQYPVPGTWLDDHPELELPLLRRARAETRFDADALFDHIVADVIRTVESRAARPGR